MKPTVVQSINDATGSRCVDIVQSGDGFAFIECRRDPEDSHGWRRLGAPIGAFASQQVALAEARKTVGWLEGST